MQVEALDGSLARQIDDVVEALRTSVGYRSVWIDPFGMLWHCEPEDEELEAMGHRYVGTFQRPDGDTLATALTGLAWPAVACLEIGFSGEAARFPLRAGKAVAETPPFHRFAPSYP